MARRCGRLPGGTGALADLPATPTGCVAAPPAAGPPVTLVPVANVSGDPLGVLLGIDGRWASGRREPDTEITAVLPDGRRTPLGIRRGVLGEVRPDGTGGAWWLEATADEAGPITLVHGRPGAVEERAPAVAHPAPREGEALIPDLGGRPPLLATRAGAFRIDSGVAERVVEGRIDGGVVRADGRGWVLADGRLLALDGYRVAGPVIDAGDRRDDPAPVAVQLANGVAPARLALPDAAVTLDGTGRAIVVSGGVVLAVDDAGTATVVAQDPRLNGVSTAEGGFAVFDTFTHLRVDLPG